MGFPEGRKLAGDVNKKIGVSTDELVMYINMMNGKLEDMCSILMEIAAKTGEKQYVSGTNVIKTIYSETYTQVGVGVNNALETDTFTAQYNGTLNLIFKVKGSDQYGNTLYAKIYKNGESFKSQSYQNPSSQEEEISITFSVVAGNTYSARFYCNLNTGKPFVGPVNICGYVQTVE